MKGSQIKNVQKTVKVFTVSWLLLFSHVSVFADGGPESEEASSNPFTSLYTGLRDYIWGAPVKSDTEADDVSVSPTISSNPRRGDRYRNRSGGSSVTPELDLSVSGNVSVSACGYESFQEVPIPGIDGLINFVQSESCGPDAILESVKEENGSAKVENICMNTIHLRRNNICPRNEISPQRKKEILDEHLSFEPAQEMFKAQVEQNRQEDLEKLGKISALQNMIASDPEALTSLWRTLRDFENSSDAATLTQARRLREHTGLADEGVRFGDLSYAEFTEKIFNCADPADFQNEGPEFDSSALASCGDDIDEPVKSLVESGLRSQKNNCSGTSGEGLCPSGMEGLAQYIEESMNVGENRSIPGFATGHLINPDHFGAIISDVWQQKVEGTDTPQIRNAMANAFENNWPIEEARKRAIEIAVSNSLQGAPGDPSSAMDAVQSAVETIGGQLFVQMGGSLAASYLLRPNEESPLSVDIGNNMSLSQDVVEDIKTRIASGDSDVEVIVDTVMNNLYGQEDLTPEEMQSIHEGRDNILSFTQRVFFSASLADYYYGNNHSINEGVNLISANGNSGTPQQQVENFINNILKPNEEGAVPKASELLELFNKSPTLRVALEYLKGQRAIGEAKPEETAEVLLNFLKETADAPGSENLSLEEIIDKAKTSFLVRMAMSSIPSCKRVKSKEYQNKRVCEPLESSLDGAKALEGLLGGAEGSGIQVDDFMDKVMVYCEPVMEEYLFNTRGDKTHRPGTATAMARREACREYKELSPMIQSTCHLQNSGSPHEVALAGDDTEIIIGLTDTSAASGAAAIAASGNNTTNLKDGPPPSEGIIASSLSSTIGKRRRTNSSGGLIMPSNMRPPSKGRQTLLPNSHSGGGALKSEALATSKGAGNSSFSGSKLTTPIEPQFKPDEFMKPFIPQPTNTSDNGSISETLAEVKAELDPATQALLKRLEQMEGKQASLQKELKDAINAGKSNDPEKDSLLAEIKKLKGEIEGVEGQLEKREDVRQVLASADSAVPTSSDESRRFRSSPRRGGSASRAPAAVTSSAPAAQPTISEPISTGPSVESFSGGGLNRGRSGGESSRDEVAYSAPSGIVLQAGVSAASSLTLSEAKSQLPLIPKDQVLDYVSANRTPVLVQEEDGSYRIFRPQFNADGELLTENGQVVLAEEILPSDEIGPDRDIASFREEDEEALPEPAGSEVIRYRDLEELIDNGGPQ